MRDALRSRVYRFESLIEFGEEPFSTRTELFNFIEQCFITMRQKPVILHVVKGGKGRRALAYPGDLGQINLPEDWALTPTTVCHELAHIFHYRQAGVNYLNQQPHGKEYMVIFFEMLIKCAGYDTEDTISWMKALRLDTKRVAQEKLFN